MTDSAQDASDAEAPREALARSQASGERANGPDAVGRLAGGIGHEFRNVLMIIQTYAEFIAEQLPEGSAAHDDLAELMKAAERGAQLTNELLAFGRGGGIRIAPVEVAQAVGAVEPRLRALLTDGVALRVALAPDIPA